MTENEEVKSTSAKSNYSMKEFTFLRDRNSKNKMKAIALKSSIISE